MIVTIVTFNLKTPATLEEMTRVFQGTAPKYQGIQGLLRKHYWMSEDGKRAGGIYLWASRADADRVYTLEWKTFVEGKYGTPPAIEYLHSPVTVDNREGTSASRPDCQITVTPPSTGSVYPVTAAAPGLAR